MEKEPNKTTTSPKVSHTNNNNHMYKGSMIKHLKCHIRHLLIHVQLIGYAMLDGLATCACDLTYFVTTMETSIDMYKKLVNEVPRKMMEGDIKTARLIYINDLSQ